MNVKLKLEKPSNESEGKPKHKFDAAFGQFLEIEECFQRSKQKLKKKILKHGGQKF